MPVRVRAVISSISYVDNPWGEKMVKIGVSEEREVPGPVVVQRGTSELAREIAPVITQVLKSIPGIAGGKYRMPRLILYLTEDEWDKMVSKPNIGDIVEIKFSKESVDVEVK